MWAQSDQLIDPTYTCGIMVPWLFIKFHVYFVYYFKKEETWKERGGGGGGGGGGVFDNKK